jgi:exonuclease III
VPSALSPRRKKKRHTGPVLIFRGAQLLEALSADETDARKVVIWFQRQGLPPREEVEETVRRLLGEERFVELVSSVRYYGVAENRRAEVICSSVTAREVVLHDLRTDRSAWKGLHAKSIVAGRTWKERRTAARAAPQPPKVQQRLQVPLRNSFECLSAGDWTRQLKVGTWNACGLLPTAAITGELLREQWLDVLAVCETYVEEGRGAQAEFPGMTYFGREMPKGSRRGKEVPVDSHGVALFVRDTLAKWFRVVKPLPKFRDSLWIQGKGGDSLNLQRRKKGGSHGHVRASPRGGMWVGAYYLSPSLPIGRVRSVIEEMAGFIARAKAAGAHVVIMGDLNADLRPKGHPQRKKNPTPRERALLSLCERFNLRSLYQQLPPKAHTHHRKGKGVSLIDHILVDEACLEDWGETAVGHELDLGSDHWLLSSRIQDWFSESEAAQVTPQVVTESRPGSMSFHKGWDLTQVRKVRMGSRKEGQSHGTPPRRHPPPVLSRLLCSLLGPPPLTVSLLLPPVFRRRLCPLVPAPLPRRGQLPARGLFLGLGRGAATSRR